MSNFQMDIQELADELVQTLVKKNHDYGNSFQNTFNKFGDAVALIRLSDKLLRYETLITEKQKVNDESIDDTLLDIAGYALLTLQARAEREVRDAINHG